MASSQPANSRVPNKSAVHAARTPWATRGPWLAYRRCVPGPAQADAWAASRLCYVALADEVSRAALNRSDGRATSRRTYDSRIYSVHVGSFDACFYRRCHCAGSRSSGAPVECARRPALARLPESASQERSRLEPGDQARAGRLLAMAGCASGCPLIGVDSVDAARIVAPPKLLIAALAPISCHRVRPAAEGA
jgi:hypothetical protein